MVDGNNNESDFKMEGDDQKRHCFFAKKYVHNFLLKQHSQCKEECVAIEDDEENQNNQQKWFTCRHGKRTSFKLEYGCSCRSIDFDEFQLGPVQWEQPINDSKHSFHKRQNGVQNGDSQLIKSKFGSSSLQRSQSSKSNQQSGWTTYRHPIFDPIPTVIQVFSICVAVDLFLLYDQYKQVQFVPMPWLTFWTAVRIVLMIPSGIVLMGVIKYGKLNTWALRISFVIYLMDRVVEGFTDNNSICAHTSIQGAFLMGILWDMLLWMFAFGKDLFWGELLYWINIIATITHMSMVTYLYGDKGILSWTVFLIYAIVFISVSLAMILTSFIIGGELDRLLESRSYINQYVKTQECAEYTIKILLSLKENWLAASMLLVGLTAILFMDTYIRLEATNEGVLAKVVLFEVTLSYLMGHLSNMEYIEQQLRNIDASSSVLSDLIPLDVANQLQEQVMNSRIPSRSISSTSSELSELSASSQLEDTKTLIQIVKNCIQQFQDKKIQDDIQSIQIQSRRSLQKQQSSFQRVLSLGSPRRSLNRSMTKGHGFVAVLFTDIKGFTRLANSQSPVRVMKLLNELYYKYDLLAQRLGVYKVETVGDCYVCATGLDVQSNNQQNRNKQQEEDSVEDAVDRMLKMAIAMCSVAQEQQTPSGQQLHFRIGIHSGQVTSGVLGRTRQRYCLFGEAVKGAALMEATCPTDSIQISDRTYRRMEDVGNLSMQWIRHKVDTGENNTTMGTYVCGANNVSRTMTTF